MWSHSNFEIFCWRRSKSFYLLKIGQKTSSLFVTWLCLALYSFHTNWDFHNKILNIYKVLRQHFGVIFFKILKSAFWNKFELYQLYISLKVTPVLYKRCIVGFRYTISTITNSPKDNSFIHFYNESTVLHALKLNMYILEDGADRLPAKFTKECLELIHSCVTMHWIAFLKFVKKQ